MPARLWGPYYTYPGQQAGYCWDTSSKPQIWWIFILYSMLMYVALAYAGLTCCLLGRMLAQSSPFQICLLAQLSIWQDENKTKLWTRLSLYRCFRLFWYDSILDDQHINLPCPSVFIYCKYHNRTYNYSNYCGVRREREREKKNMEHSAQHTPSPPPPPKTKSNNHPNHPNRPSSSTLNVQGAVRWVGPVAELLTPKPSELHRWNGLNCWDRWGDLLVDRSPLKIGCAMYPQKQPNPFASAKKTALVSNGGITRNIEVVDKIQHPKRRRFYKAWKTNEFSTRVHLS